MSKLRDGLTQDLASGTSRELSNLPRRDWRLWLALAALIACFASPLYSLVGFAIQSSLYSYILVVPVVSGYFILSSRNKAVDFSPPNRALALLLLAAGGVLLLVYFLVIRSGRVLAEDDSLAFTTLSFVFFFCGTCALFLGRQTIRALAFPLGFLVFMTPMPVAMANGVETFLQQNSAIAAVMFFKVSGMSVFRDGTFIQLPGFSMNVAPECSGIRSSVALFITSVVAAHMFLKSPWKRAVLALAVIPLALLRNGLRVFVIGQLCVHIGPHMIHSYIHRQGGPIFFAISLVPFSLLLFFLVKSERRARPSMPPSS